MTRSIINGDVSLFIANVMEGTSPISIQEAKLRSYLDSLGPNTIKAYTFTGWTLN
jgi:hypothetical protein